MSRLNRYRCPLLGRGTRPKPPVRWLAGVVLELRIELLRRTVVSISRKDFFHFGRKTWRTGRWKLLAQPCPIASQQSFCCFSRLTGDAGLVGRGYQPTRMDFLLSQDVWMTICSIRFCASISHCLPRTGQTDVSSPTIPFRRSLVDILPWKRQCGVCRLDPILMANGTFYSESPFSSLCTVCHNLSVFFGS